MGSAESNERDLVDLPRLEDVFKALRRGRHICLRDGGLYQAVKSKADGFTDLFRQLGFELVHHPRDFFYFVDRGNFTELSSRMAVFMFVLIEDLADRGDPVEETLMTRRFRVADLPHLVGDRYRRLMREAGVSTPADLDHALRTMERFGFCERLPDDSFAFRPPAYRFLDLCLDMATDAPHTEEASAEEEAP